MMFFTTTKVRICFIFPFLSFSLAIASDKNSFGLFNAEEIPENHEAPILAKESTSDAEVAGHCQKHCPLTVHSRHAGSGRNSPECGAPAGAE